MLSPNIETSWWQRMRHTDATVIFLVALIGAYAQTAILIMPIMVGGWVTSLGMSDSVAGLIGSATLVGTTVGLATSVILLRHRSHAWITILGIVIALVSDGLSIGAEQITSISFLRFMAGLGYGLTLAAVVSWFARHEMAARCFGTLMLLQVTIGASLLAAIPEMEARIGMLAPYLCLLVLGVISLLVAPALCLNQHSNEALTPPGINGTAASNTSTINPMALMAILSPTFFVAASVGLWVFIQRYGVTLEIDESLLGAGLATMVLAGIPATIVVILLGNRLGNSLPVLLASLSILGAVVMLMVGVSSFAAFVVAGVIYNMAWCVYIPYMQSIQAELDPTGQLAAIGTIPQAIGATVGPVGFAMALEAGNYFHGFLLVIFLFLASLALGLAPALKADRLHKVKLSQ